ncbi:response regulator transcription factor [Amantichitinum ursilacus]|nr:response regulator transcription factor [Amantichitinum ursilacus]
MLAISKRILEHPLILVDHRELVREGLSRLINELADISLAAQTGDGLACLRLVEQIQPDVVVCSAQLPGMTGIELMTRLRDMHPSPRTVLVGGQESHDWVNHAVRAGVSGLVMQRDSSNEFLAAITAARDGRLYLSSIANALFSGHSGGATSACLTPRQREILHLYAMGQGTKQIAYGLGLSVKTVATHREQILARLGLRNTTDLIRYAIREGMIEL